MYGTQTGSFHYLHFSDLHLASEANFDTEVAREQLLEFLTNETIAGRLSCDYIFFTGDIAYQNNYSGAKAFIERLFQSLCWDPDKYNQVFWTVGNHDISRESELRKLVINDIRKAPNSEQRFEERMKNAEFRDVLLLKGMSDYDYWHEESQLYRYAYPVDLSYHTLHKLPNLNLIVLNTCLTSCDDNDKYNLCIIESGLSETFTNLDVNNPTFVIGHHGKIFFTDETQIKLGHLFGIKKVDLYLCGHSHRPGYDVFPQTQHQVHQITCGSGMIDGYSVFSFMHGYYDRLNSTVTIKPYSYAERGNRRWNLDGTSLDRLDGNTPLQLKNIEQIPQPKIKAKVSIENDSNSVKSINKDQKSWSASFFNSTAPITKKERV